MLDKIDFGKKFMFDLNKHGSIASILGLIMSIPSLFIGIIGVVGYDWTKQFLTGDLKVNFVILSLLMVFSGVLAVVSWLSFSLKRGNDKLQKEREELDAEYKRLKEACDGLESKSCIFKGECEEFRVLSKHLGEEHGFFDNAEELEKKIETCKKCARGSGDTKRHPNIDKQLSQLEEDVKIYIERLGRQSFKVFIDFCDETAEFASAVQNYLEEQQIRCAKLTDKQKESLLNVVLSDKKTIIIVLYCDGHQGGHKPDKRLTVWLSARLDAYRQILVRIGDPKDKLQVWVCSSEKQPPSQIPQNIIWKHVKRCISSNYKHCCKREDFPN